jgi:hypothetical protein
VVEKEISARDPRSPRGKSFPQQGAHAVHAGARAGARKRVILSPVFFPRHGPALPPARLQWTATLVRQPGVLWLFATRVDWRTGT